MTLSIFPLGRVSSTPTRPLLSTRLTFDMTAGPSFRRTTRTFRNFAAGAGCLVETVKATYGAGKRQKDVTATLRQLTRGKGSLRIGNYNGRFGDPVGGTVKDLTITYVVNGRQKTLKLVENTPITLKKTGK